MKVKVDTIMYAESAKAWKLYTLCSDNGLVWSKPEWFPKKMCALKDGYILMPQWLYDNMFGEWKVKPRIL